ncbi:response regulator [Natrarchaeobius chitinivorans]|uniref:Response regulator n=1 Tax=Natrarchaeobius chitinivorans TaxID=1679083 RepID=A0A3N6MZ20_NATCH|nr:response regulator [Natrarchaeobius chitinivorans]RQG90832.1 response regulator [Natrarchaeobius chitinivorans]
MVSYTEKGEDQSGVGVSDGDEALTVLRDQSSSEEHPYPDIVLLDLNLPRVSGFDVLAELKDQPGLSALSVLVLTSSEAEEDIVKSYKLAANAYLTKPTGPGEFDSLIRSVEDFWFDKARIPPTSA